MSTMANAMESCCCLGWLGILSTLFVVYKLSDYLLRLLNVGQYSERYILVTGCDSGFGQAFARRLDELGCHVFAGCLTHAGQQELVKTCSERLQALDMDVTRHDSVLRALEFVKSKLPPGKGLWAMLNNAGIAGGAGPEEWITIDEYKKALDVNLFGTIDVTMTFLPLIKRSRGRVVNTSSIGGRVAVMNGSPYCVSKYAVEAFSDNLRRSLRMYGVKVALIEPGAFCTSIVSSTNLRANTTRCWNSASSEVKEEFGEDYLKECIQYADTFCKLGNSDITPVIDAYQHAVLGRFPRARYVVGLDARLFYVPLIYLPEWLGDAILGLVTSSKPVPAALKKSKIN